MIRMGLGYLTLDRHANTLSGGETQRINLTRTLGSNLINSMYILDEPSVGLHPRDTEKLVQVLKNLRDLGNTVIVIEHEEAIIRNADYLIDVGPLAGVHGGHIVFEGDYQSLYNKVTDNLTGDYLKGIRQIKPLPQKRKIVQKIFIEGLSNTTSKYKCYDSSAGAHRYLRGFRIGKNNFGSENFISRVKNFAQ